jgi:hypothetical protein
MRFTKYHTMKTYWGSEVIAPRILNLGTRSKRVVRFTPRPLYHRIKSTRHQLDKRRGGPQSPSGHGDEQKIPAHTGYEEAGYLSGIALAFGLDDRGFDSRLGLGFFLLTTASRPGLVLTQPPIQWVLGALPVGVKRPVREADHPPPSSSKVKECVELYLHSPKTPSWCGA